MDKYLYMSLLCVLGPCFCLMEFTNTTDSPSKNQQRRLYDNLMLNYNKHLKPDTPLGEPLTVILVPTIISIAELDEKKNVLMTTGSLSVNWKDESLTWDSKTYGNRIVIDGDLVWKPEIAVRNGIDSIADLSLNTDCRVQIYHNGRIMWTPVFTWKTGCQVNLRYFPFDVQTCEIQFTNWVYGANEVNLTYGVPDIDFNLYMPNGAWDLISNTVKMTKDVFTGNNWSIILPIVKVKLILERKPIYYMVHLVLPSLFMTITTILVFCVPPDAGEKMSLGITNLLSYTVMILMVSEVTPRSSDSIPAITIFIILSMGLSAFALFVASIILALHHQMPTRPVPNWIHSFVIKGLGSLLCIRRWHGNYQPNKSRVNQSPGAAHISQSSGRQISNGQTISLPEEVTEFMKVLHSERKELELQDKYKTDWIVLARIIDRFFLIIYAVVIMLSIVVVLAYVARF